MTARSLEGLRWTDGVVRTGESIAFPALGISVAVDREDIRTLLLDVGLASGYVMPPPEGVLARVLLAFHSRSRARDVSSNVAVAVAQSLVHNAIGMWRWWVLACLLSCVSLLLELPSLTAIAVAAVLFFLVVLTHELGHVIAYRCAAGACAPALMVSRGSACHLVRSALSVRRDLVVVLSGPTAPVLAGVFMLFASRPIAIAWSCIALGHLGALVFPVGDGRSLRSILQGR